MCDVRRRDSAGKRPLTFLTVASDVLDLSIEEMSRPTGRMYEIFKKFRDDINADNDKRDAIRVITRDIEESCRDCMYTLQRTHEPDIDEVELCSEVRATIATRINPQLMKIAELIQPMTTYYKYSGMLDWMFQRLAFICAYVTYLESGNLALHESAANMFGLASEYDPNGRTLYLSIENYLHGVLQLASELARYAINAVAAGENAHACHAQRFVGHLDQCFRILNLKNDNLRRKFDALKYDVQKLDQVVYDLTIRDMKPPEEVIESIYSGRDIPEPPEPNAEIEQ